MVFCFHVLLSHLSTSSSWQTEVQDKSLPAWSWRILCTVESLDLVMFDDHLSLAPVSRVEQPSGQMECKAAAQYCHLKLGQGRTAHSGLLPPLLPICARIRSGPPGWLGLLWSSVLERTPHPDHLGHSCQLEWLPLVIRSWRLMLGFLCIWSSVSTP